MPIPLTEQVPGMERIRFSIAISDPEGNVPILDLGSTQEYGANVLAGLPVGRSYTPGAHRYPVVVMVLEGSGLFFLEDDTLPYGTGSVFRVQANVRHAFVRVDTTTLFVKHV
ncbi:MAG: hypothetical protein Q8R39_01390 [bacterium]|nr:hypothetical protein [bacterium]MDZ4284908.1 hypothetical protein [Patescibacteria group bacterium]